MEEYTFFYYFDLLPTASCSLHWPFLKEALETLATLWSYSKYFTCRTELTDLGSPAEFARTVEKLFSYFGSFFSSTKSVCNTNMHTSSFKEVYGRKKKALLHLRGKTTRNAGFFTITVLLSPYVPSFLNLAKRLSFPFSGEILSKHFFHFYLQICTGTLHA